MSKQANKRLRRSLGLPVNRDALPAFAWPGGYPLVYVCADGGGALCPTCVNAEIDNIDDSTRRRLRDGWQLTGVDVHYEGEAITCDHCGADIDSAYGPVETADPVEHDWNGDNGEECPCADCLGKRRALYLDWHKGSGLPERR